MSRKAIIIVAVIIIIAVIVLFPTLSGGIAYFLEDPEACTTCHIMNPYYYSWADSAHADEATCNDCHVAKGPVVEWTSKGHAAVRHAWVFFLRQTPDVIDIHPTLSIPIIQDNCVRCHFEEVNKTNLIGELGDHKTCIDCHRHTPHGEFIQNDRRS
ncbi:NapC/NirT family cytochrome c [Desulfuribacillus alkaliarsenatis]|nr:NapC/NirT family cytochrome c [Desulfuribacillus alkaliarsenatis]